MKHLRKNNAFSHDYEKALNKLNYNSEAGNAMVLKRQVDIDLIYKLLPILCKQTAALCVRCLKNIVLLHTMTSNCFGVAEKNYVAVNEWMKWM